MSDPRRYLLDLSTTDHTFDHPRSEILPLQLEAARALFAERREQIPVLARRAEEAGV